LQLVLQLRLPEAQLLQLIAFSERPVLLQLRRKQPSCALLLLSTEHLAVFSPVLLLLLASGQLHSAS
jgi:hypothetical protein